MKDWLIVIPARLESTRLHEKPLQDLGGKPLIVRVYENLKPLKELGAKIIVATDSEKIYQCCEQENVEVEMTSDAHQSGTDRCQEVASRHDYEFVLNVQGDEPFADTESLINLCNKLKQTTWAEMATVVQRVEDGVGYFDKNIVKVTLTTEGKALYFSRAPIPLNRQDPDGSQPFYQHQGVYAFKRDTLKNFVSLPVSPLENLEKLEQLRALEHGMSILCVMSSKKSIGIDTQADLDEASKIFHQNLEK